MHYILKDVLSYKELSMNCLFFIVEFGCFVVATIQTTVSQEDKEA